KNDVQTLVAEVKELGIEVVIIDPLYLCALKGATTRIETANFMQMGPLFKGFTSQLLEVGCTPVLLHHTVKRTNRKQGEIELDDLSYAGVSEFARQWLLFKSSWASPGLWNVTLYTGATRRRQVYHFTLDEGFEDDPRWIVKCTEPAEGFQDDKKVFDAVRAG